jgi:hypothetical protein
MGRTLPRKDEEFMNWALSIKRYCAEHQTLWNLSPETLQEFDTLSNVAHTAYQENNSSDTSNRISSANKRAAFAELRKFLQFFVYILRANKSIDESDLEVMGIPSRKRHVRHPLPVPHEAPQMHVVTMSGHEVKVSVRVPQHDHATKSLTRKAYHGFVVRFRKEGEDDWHEEYTTRLHTNLIFNSEDEGKRLILAAAWINPRLQHGPWSGDIHTVVN